MTGTPRAPRVDGAGPAVGSQVHHVRVGAEPIDVAALRALVDSPRAGAVVVFDGVVRDHDHGRSVDRLVYEAHPSAESVLAQVVSQVLATQPQVSGIACEHRVGDIPIGEAALVVVAAAEHRAEAFDACREVVEQVKHRIPVWKHQYFTDGTDEWVNCA